MVGGVNFTNRPTLSADAWDDGSGHGTHVAGTIGRRTTTRASSGSPPRPLYAVKVLADDGTGDSSDIAAGIEWVVSKGIRVANISFGGPSDSIIAQAVDKAAASGVFFAVAAGNDTADTRNTCPANSTSPGVATVSALADTDGKPGGGSRRTAYGPEDWIATFSNYGRNEPLNGDPAGNGVDVIAPGVKIYSTFKGGGYTTLTGTSMATPHATGVAALFVAAFVSANPGEKPSPAQIKLGILPDPRPRNPTHTPASTTSSATCPGVRSTAIWIADTPATWTTPATSRWWTPGPSCLDRRGPGRWTTIHRPEGRAKEIQASNAPSPRAPGLWRVDLAGRHARPRVRGPGSQPELRKIPRRPPALVSASGRLLRRPGSGSTIGFGVPNRVGCRTALRDRPKSTSWMSSPWRSCRSPASSCTSTASATSSARATSRATRRSALTFKQAEVSDVLKSLTVLDLDGGHVAVGLLRLDQAARATARRGGAVDPRPGQPRRPAAADQGGAASRVACRRRRAGRGDASSASTRTRTADRPTASSSVVLAVAADRRRRGALLRPARPWRAADPRRGRCAATSITTCSTQLSAKKKDARTFTFFAQGEGDAPVAAELHAGGPGLEGDVPHPARRGGQAADDPGLGGRRQHAGRGLGERAAVAGRRAAGVVRPRPVHAALHPPAGGRGAGDDRRAAAGGRGAGWTLVDDARRCEMSTRRWPQPRRQPQPRRAMPRWPRACADGSHGRPSAPTPAQVRERQARRPVRVRDRASGHDPPQPVGPGADRAAAVRGPAGAALQQARRGPRTRCAASSSRTPPA